MHINDDTKITILSITGATKNYAEARGALFDKAIGWHYIGDVPLELEEFVNKPARTREQNISVFCPLCGSQMKLSESKAGNLFWGCMTFPTCRGTRDVSETIDKGAEKSIAELINAELSNPSQKTKTIQNNYEHELATEIAQMAVANLGSLEAFDKWAAMPKIALNRKTPNEAMLSIEGLKKVLELLRDINK